MLTNSDIIKLKGIFATREDLKEDLKKFATKEDLKRFATKDDLKSLATKSELKDLKYEFISRFDEVMFELKAIREELTMGVYRRSENSDAIQNHEDRITTVEKKLSF